MIYWYQDIKKDKRWHISENEEQNRDMSGEIKVK